MKVIFRPKLIPTLCTIAIAPMLAGLGFWQMDRAQQKIDIQSKFESRYHAPPVSIGARLESAEEMEFRQIRTTGTWDSAHEFFLDNRVLNSRAGFHVITPLIFRGGQSAVLVNRGWIPASPDRSVMPEVNPLVGESVVTGTATIPPQDPFVLEQAPPLDDGWQTVWQTLDLDRFSQAVPYEIQGFIIQLSVEHQDGFEREWSPPGDNWIYRHKAYAVQWFALCGALLVIYFLFAFSPAQRDEN